VYRCFRLIGLGGEVFRQNTFFSESKCRFLLKRLTHSLEENPGNALSVLRGYSEQIMDLLLPNQWFDVKKPLVSQQQISVFSMTNQWFLNVISMESQ